jgi:hypothetical protein
LSQRASTSPLQDEGVFADSALRLQRSPPARAVIIYDGREYRVDHPAVVPLRMAEDSFSPRDRRAHRLFGVTECLTVRRVPADELASPPGIRRGTDNRC